MDIDKRFFIHTSANSLLLLLVLVLINSSSCRSRRVRSASKGVTTARVAEQKFDEIEASDKLESLLSDRTTHDSVWAKNKVYNVSKVMQKVYHDEDYFPVWLTQNGDTSYIVRLLNDLDSMKFDGLNPERYKVSEIKKLLSQYSSTKKASIDLVIALDTICTRSYLQASKDLLFGAIVPKQVDSLWFHANDSVWHPYTGLAKMGMGDADYPSLDSFRSRIVTYSLLRYAMIRYDKLQSDSNYHNAKEAISNGIANDSIKGAVIKNELPWEVVNDSAGKTSYGNLLSAYQYYIGAKNYSKKDSLTRVYLSYPVDTLFARAAVNMERIRWMQQQPEEKYVLVNVPLMELFLRINGYDSMHMEVVVGKTIRQTPSLSANMANVVINPPWGVPPTIMKKDVMPGMAKSGKAYLRKKGLKVYDFKGKLVDASVVNAGNYKKYVFRQDPGDDNSLGYVKFNLPNKLDIYLHDTPHREDFGKKDRFQSSGCIRVQKPKEMAEFILATLEGRRYTRERIDSIIETKKTRYEVLKNKIPVHIVYLTAFEDSTGKRFHFIYDMYKRDGRLKAALVNN